MGGSGARDIWTVAVGGGEAVEVTNDLHIDWNPTWSADGRLLICERPSGTLNLWRVPIDAATGRTMARRSPSLRPPAGPLRSACLARADGSPSRPGRSAPRSTASPSTRSEAGWPEHPSSSSVARAVIDSLGLSPDGEWVAFTSGGLQENIFLVRLDGTGYRQLTDDEFRNRGPSWSADGSVIGFYSNRSGHYDAWTLRPDGSNLELLARAEAGSLWYPEWSPDGRQIAVAGSSTSRMLDPGKPFGERIVLELPRLPDGTVFHAVSWSADARQLAGMGLLPDGSSGGVWLYHVESRRYERVTTSGQSRSCWRTAGGWSTTTRAACFASWTQERAIRGRCPWAGPARPTTASSGLARQPADRVPARRDRGRHLADESGVRGATYAISRTWVATAAACSSTIGRPMPAT